ncbi:16S rRNA (cytosine(1402)-N(4))-methyltransferase RsmH [Candidatus Peregrinibacteria bacterium]|nr:16S rRNA (cytosine(1402)-N(4))-methyltransferase RsmH [Candidatus Peregrinibacteria bacterium]
MGLTQDKIHHISVLRQLVQKYLNLSKSDIAVDCTLGLGGHSQDILEKIGPKGLLIAFEQDEQNLKTSKNNLTNYKNVVFIHQNFEFLANELKKRKIKQVNGILLDLGLCSSHFELENRGFSFQKNDSLDMRFSKELTCKTAADIINKYSVQELTDIFREYGEEKFAYRIACAININRKIAPIQTTGELAKLIEEVVPRSRHERIHPATKVFQALRIEVNQELETLKNVLPQATAALAPQGRLVIISYHSLEDRIVKHFLKFQARACICPPHILICNCEHEPTLTILTKKPVRPSKAEIHANPRSRSALLRAAEKL